MSKVYRLADYRGDVLREVPVDAQIQRRDDGFYDVVGSGQVDVLTTNDRPTKKAKRPLSTQAAAAKAIRGELKAAYPTVKFKVTSSSFSMGDDVKIRWTDGPTTKEIEAIVGKYEYGTFNGMIDLYEYTNTRDDIPQSKFVMTERHYSNDARRALIAWMNRTFGYELQIVERPGYNGGPSYLDVTNDKPRGNGSGWQSHDEYRYMQALSLLCKSCNAATLPADAYCPMCGTAQPTIPLNV
jgi:hypothetical protein